MYLYYKDGWITPRFSQICEITFPVILLVRAEAKSIWYLKPLKDVCLFVLLLHVPGEGHCASWGFTRLERSRNRYLRNGGDKERSCEWGWIMMKGSFSDLVELSVSEHRMTCCHVEEMDLFSGGGESWENTIVFKKVIGSYKWRE